MASDEEDYMTMRFAEKSREPQTETYSQRRARKLREHETARNIRPAKELERERREEGLARNLFAEQHVKETKAMKMMKLMGYTYLSFWVGLTVSEGKPLGAKTEESEGYF